MKTHPTFRFLSLLFLLVSMAPASPVSENRKGNKSYDKGKYAEAAGHYKNAEIEAPERKEISYNLANAYYREKNFEEALKSYDRARTSKNPELRKKALFNRGNALYRAGSNPQDQGAQQKLEQAVQSYKEVLKLDPRDNAAKFNLQKTLELIQQQQQQQKNNPDSSGNKNQDQKQNQEKKQQQKEKDQEQKKDQEKQDQQKQDDQDKKDGQKNQEKENQEEQKPGEQKAPPPKAGQMSEEEAKRLLDAMKQDESDMQKRLMKLKIPGRGLDKDW